MKKPKKFLCLILAMVILIPNIALLSTAFAQTADSEPLKIEVTTDKSSYTAYGIAEITVKVTNTNDEAVNNISAEAVFEQLAPVGKNNETFKEIESLQSGESFTFSYKATLNANKVNINFFEKIILWFVRLFNGGYTATSHNIEADTENITEIKFGNYTAENVVKVGYKKILNNSEAYNQLIHNVNIDEVYQHNSENLSKDEQSGIEFTNNIIMIMFDWDCTDQRKADIINSVNGKVVGGITGYNELHIEIEKSSLEELEAICDKLNINDDIYASYDTVKHISNITGIPNDPWGITDDNEDINWENAFESSHTWSAVAIDAPGAWQYNDYFNTINIGIVDDGFSTQNKDLNLRVVSAENSPEDHGTKVAGIIGATANNNTGIAGVVWNKNIFAYDAKSSSGMYESDIYNGIETLVKRDCKVINLSIGSHEALNDKQIKREGKTASKKMAQLLEKGHDFIIVQAAGNGDSNYIGFDAIKNGNFCSVTSDNCYSNKNISKNDIMNRIIIVANSDRNFNTGSFVCAQSSNGGKQVDIAAPGANILSTTISTDFPYNLDSGTSMAAPFVTGVASLVWSVNSNFTGEEVKQIVLDAAEKGGVIVEDNEASPTTCDFYMVNAKLAVEEAINRTSPKITGTVKDSSTNEIIDKLITIKIIDSDNIIVNHTKAGKNGVFSVNVPAGNYTILIECEGYVSNSDSITVGNNNSDINLGIILLKSNNSSENGTTEDFDESGDIIIFGSYPQSEVTDETLISALNQESKTWKSYDYYAGTGNISDGKMTASEYMQYADVSYGGERYRAVKFTQYRPYYTGYVSSSDNSYQDDNGYYTDTVYWFKYEPLQWRVLDPEEGLIMCESIIDSQAYSNTIYYNSSSSRYSYYNDSSYTIYANDYSTSSIRKWLNDDFYNTAFSSNEKTEILTVECNNSCYSSSYPKLNGETTYDKIFLLSYDEVCNSEYGFESSSSSSDTARIAQGTDYAKCQGLEIDTNSENSWWWLRTPNSGSGLVCEVFYKGYIPDFSLVYGRCYVNYTSKGVRPALQIKTN